jgi:ketosteroid isomerase-like protein
MESAELWKFGERYIAAWNTQIVDEVVACYSEDLVYVDPNTRGPVEGADAMRRYLTKLFGRWQMHWTIKEIFPLVDPAAGCAVLWHASFARPDGEEAVEVDGMDLVVLAGVKVKRNEVYFDRAALAPLVSAGEVAVEAA